MGDNLLIYGILVIVDLAILYFVIYSAVKQAIKDSRKETKNEIWTKK